MSTRQPWLVGVKRVHVYYRAIDMYTQADKVNRDAISKYLRESYRNYKPFPKVQNARRLAQLAGRCAKLAQQQSLKDYWLATQATMEEAQWATT